MAEKIKKRATLDIIARYDYKNANGATIYQVCESRNGSKRVRSPDPRDPSQWRWGRAKWGITAVPYRLPDFLSAAKRGVDTLWIVPAERDADELAKKGIAATCALWDGEPRDNEWKKEWSEWIADFRRAVVIARKDPPPKDHDAKNVLAAYLGQRRAQQVVSSISKAFFYRNSIKCLTLPDVDGKTAYGPAAWFDAGGTLDALKEAVRAAPPWKCPDAMDECSADELARMASDIHSGLAPERPGKESRAASSVSPSGASSPSTPAPSVEKARKNVGGAVASNGGVGEGGDEDEGIRSFSYLRAQLIKVLADAEASGNQKKRVLCETVTAWLIGRGKFFYDINERTHAAAMWFDAQDKRLHRVNEDYFASWLARATAFNRELRDFKFFKAAIEDESLVGDYTAGVEPRRYWARQGDAVYLSCGEGRAVRVTKDGCETVDNGTDNIVFEQGFTLDDWTLVEESASVDPFEQCAVFRTMSTLDGRGKMLTKLWFMSMFGVTGWKPLLVLTGTVGSGKTRVATAFFELMGMPARVSGIDTMGNIKDFWTSIDKGGLYVLDNADHRIEWLPDALSTISTGATFEKKKLYTDTSTVTQKARCWAVVTSANPSFASDAGLADRLITVQLERAERDTAESALVREITEARDAGLSWICHMTRRALADTGDVPKRLNSRHPDWAAWAFRLARAMGAEDEGRKAICENEAFKSLFAVSNDAFCRFLLTGIDEPFDGSVATLSEILSQKCEGYSRELWTDVKIGKALKRMEAHLMSVFAMVKTTPCGKANYKLWPRKDTAIELPAPVPDLLSTPHNVGVMGGAAAKVAGNTIIHDFYTTTPHNPNIVRGEVELEEVAGPCGPGEESGWDSL